MAKQFLILICLFNSIYCLSQSSSFEQEKIFLSHLDSLNIAEEKIAYLEYLKQDTSLQNNDTLNLELAHAFFLSNKYDKALQTFSSINGFKNNDKFKREYGFSLLKKRMYGEYLSKSGEWPESKDSVLIIQKQSAFVLANRNDAIARRELRIILQLHTSEKKLQKKSPLLAGLYSTVLPGSGKLYCGKKHQFVTTLIANAALGFQTYEAAVKDGTNSARFIVSGILFSFFYIGNIWGSVLAAKNYNIEQYKEFEHEILDNNGILVSQ